MKNEAACGGGEEFRASQQDPDLAEIDMLIERSTLGTPAAKSLRERTPIEAVQPILARANSLGVGPFAIGIEILPHELSSVLTDHHGIIHGRRRWPLPNMEVGTVVKYAAKTARDLAATALGLDLPNPCIVIGLSLGGPVDSRTGTVILYENNPTDPTTLKPHLRYRWEGVKLAELVEQETGCRTVLVNDATAFGAREQKFGVGQEMSTYAVILIRDGVGHCMIVDGKPLPGPLEWGHIIVWPDGRACECGLVGDIESQAGRRAIRAVAREETGISTDLEWQAAVELALGDGDLADKALRAFERAGEAIGRGIATLVTLFSPACVVIYAPGELIGPSGGNSRIADAFKSAVEEFPQHAFPPKHQCGLVTRALQPTDGPLGAALIALSRLFSVPLARTSPNWSTPDGSASRTSPRRESPSASHRA
jgi:predicted NBD/HSP70 family sugar kinase